LLQVPTYLTYPKHTSDPYVSAYSTYPKLLVDLQVMLKIVNLRCACEQVMDKVRALDVSANFLERLPLKLDLLVIPDRPTSNSR